MSKSLGNLVLVRNLLPEYTPDAVRLMLLSHHYHEEWEYSVEDMRVAAALAERLAAAARLASDGAEYAHAAAGDDSDATARQARLEVVAALEDDFQTQQAIQALDRLAASVLSTKSPVQADMLRTLAGVLGLTLA